MIATGTPEQVAAVPELLHGQFLADLVEPEVKVRRAQAQGARRRLSRRRDPIRARGPACAGLDVIVARPERLRTAGRSTPPISAAPG